MNIIIIILLVIILLLVLNSNQITKITTPFNTLNNNEFFTVFDYASMDDLYDEPYIINNIITEEEAKYIIDMASVKFNDSLVLDNSTDGKLDTNIRKSKTAWMHKDDPLILNIMTRIANIVNIPLENAESLQVVKYEPNGYYKHHHDSCCDNNNSCVQFTKNGGQRIKTVLIYLNDDFTEGSTDFPALNKKIKPPKYCAVVFNPLAKNSNKCHPKALHAGLPVESGIKYIANLWFRENKFE
jgi:prolyl 4-hydroxylase